MVLGASDDRIHAQLQELPGPRDSWTVRSERYALSSNRCCVHMCKGNECGREVARDARCIFHLEEKTDDEAQLFDRAFVGELDRLEKSEESLIDLTGFVFPRPLNMRQHTFSKPVVFEKAAFLHEAHFDRAAFLGDARFDGVVFSGHAGFGWTTFSRDARFTEATFSDGAWFDGATFSGDARFDRAAFLRLSRFSPPPLGNAWFVGARFSRGAGFAGAKFSGYTRFNGVTFSGSASFHGATFEDGAMFDGVVFSGGAGFTGATFSRDAMFGGVTFSGGASFSRTAFLHVASFPGATFSHNVSFEEAIFSSDARFDDVTFANVIFRENVFRRVLRMSARFEGLAVFERVLFQRDTIESSDLCALLEPTPLENMPLTWFGGASVGPNGEVRFIQPREYDAHLKIERNFAIDRVSFLDVDLSRFSFLDVEWGRYHNRKAVIEEALMGRPPFENVTPEQIREICARLRANQEKAFRYAEAGDFFIGEMDMRRRSLRDEGWRAFPERFLLWLFSGLSRYGESISRPTLATVVIIFGLAAMRLVLHEPAEWRLYQPLSVEESLARSVASFFQLRSSTLWTDILERLVSIPILGVLFIALKRKLERRP